MTDRYPYPQILELWEDLPSIKLRYSEDETGWAK
jgi:hypothetical protein